MSWSVSASGSPETAMAEAKRQFEGTCANPGFPPGEAGRAQKVMEAIEGAVLVAPEGTVVTIRAWGSESYKWEGGERGALTEALANFSVTVSPPSPASLT